MPRHERDFIPDDYMFKIFYCRNNFNFLGVMTEEPTEETKKLYKTFVDVCEALIDDRRPEAKGCPETCTLRKFVEGKL